MKIAYVDATFLTLDKENNVYENAMMITDGEVISYIGSFKKEKVNQVDRVFSLQGKWVLPGLVNTHSHLLMTILRGSADDLPLKKWLDTKIWPMESKFTTEIAITSAKLGIIEMLKSGTTTFSDMFNPTGIDADAVIESIASTGIKGAFSYSIFGNGKENNVAKADTFTKKYRSFADGRLITMAAPHSPYACDADALLESARIAHDNNTMIHLHVAETRQEVENSMKDHGCRPMEYLKKLGLFEQKTIMAHGVYLSESEIDILKAFDVSVAHNPISNLKLGSGIADIKRLIEHNIKVGIATDSTASNNNLDMFEETRTAALLQKGMHENAEAIPVKQALALATRSGAEAINKGDIGSLEIGKKADFITIAPEKAHLLPHEQHLSHLLYSSSGKDVSDVFIDGVQMVKNGECLTIDEGKVTADVQQLYRKFFQ